MVRQLQSPTAKLATISPSVMHWGTATIDERVKIFFSETMWLSKAPSLKPEIETAGLSKAPSLSLKKKLNRSQRGKRKCIYKVKELGPPAPEVINYTLLLTHFRLQR